MLTASTEDEWLKLGTVATDAVPFTTSENEALAARTATVTLIYTYGNSQIVTKNVTVTQAGNPNVSGGANNPYTVTEALAVINALDDGGKTESEVYVTGVISAIDEVAVYNPTDGSGYGNALYFISIDGTTTTQLEVYHGFYLNKTKFTAEGQIQVGDKVVVCGQLQKYKDKNDNITPEIASGNYIVSQSVPVSIAEAATDGTDYYGTLYYGEKNLKVPTRMTAITYKVNNGKLTVSKEYEAGSVIPKGTAVVLKAESYGDFSFEVTSEAGVGDADNMLRGTDVAADTNAGAGSWLYYKLSTKNNKNLGFYWGADDGAAFQNGANKAYLAVPTGESNGKSGFVFGEVVTAINGVAIETGNAAIYNLNGQRVDKNYKGVVIVNGKKMINK